MDRYASTDSKNSIVSQMLDHGYAVVTLRSDERSVLSRLDDESKKFFARSLRNKSRHSFPKENRTNGYRPYEDAFADPEHPEKPDANDSFIYWNESAGTRIPHSGDIAPYLAAFEAYRRVVARIMRALINELCDHYDYKFHPSFEKASLLQTNAYGRPSDDELLQQLHEDGTVATVHWTTAPGLETVRDYAVQPASGDESALVHPVFKHKKREYVDVMLPPDQVLVFPGSILYFMTGGQITPFYHRVHNYNNPLRRSVMYFSCFDVDQGYIQPFLVNDVNKNIDIVELIKNSTDMFGLPDEFVGNASSDTADEPSDFFGVSEFS